jgi:hypothetical protein
VLAYAPLDDPPATLMVLELSADDGMWTNACYAKRFGLTKVRVAPRSTPPAGAAR